MRTWVEYSPDTGEQVSVVDAGEAKYPGHSWRVMSADEYRHYKEHYENLIERSKDKYEIAPPMPREEFEGAEFLLADGETAITKPEIQTGTAYVVVLPDEARLINDPDTLILAEYPFDSSKDHGVEKNSLTMLINTSRDEGMGQIKEVSENRLAWQSAFLKDENGDPIPVKEGTATGVSTYKWSDKEPVGPVQWVGVTSTPFAADVTDENGKYVLVTVNDIFCPVPTEWFYSITAEFQYRRFNPKNRGGSRGVYFKQRAAYSYCTPLMVWAPWFGPLSSGVSSSGGSQQILNIDFPLEVSVLSGEAFFANPTSVRGDQVILSPEGSHFFNQESETSFKAEDPDNEKTITEGYDFDNDEELDTVKLGHYEFDEEDNKIFVEDAEINDEFDQFQAVWFSSTGKTPGENLPDITRVLDSISFLNFNHEGLLEGISKEDVKNTDFYVVRVSDGRLIAERLGMHEQEATNGYAFGENTDRGSFFYSQMLYGNAANFGRPPGFSRKFEELQSRAGINPELHQRKADHLKPGDQIRVFAINRTTGYMGSVDTYIRGNGENGDLSFPIEPILMGPPNLRIWAERNYEIKHGLTKGEVRENQIIGFEGGSLNTDKFVAIHSRWLDHKGRPIPESLKGAGFTARLAALSGDKELPNGSDGVYQFDIDPGQNLQIIQLSSNTGLESQHYYIHVSGEPSSGNPIFNGNETRRLGEVDFSSSGKNEGVLEKRPDYYVPFMVPLFDERNTEIQRQAYTELSLDPDYEERLEKPTGIYHWTYRPEMQFSNYGLSVSEIRYGDDVDGDGSLDSNAFVDLLAEDSPIIPSSLMTEILYSLSLTDLMPLDFINAGEEKQLILNLGGHEIVLNQQPDGRVFIENADHLSDLTPEDFLTLSVYTNSDVGNLLWEYAFEYLSIFSREETFWNEGGYGTYIVTADDPVVPLGAAVTGQYWDELEEPRTLKWTVEGDGALDITVDRGKKNSFSNVLRMEAAAGARAKVSAILGAGIEESFDEVVVIPGQPYRAIINFDGEAYNNGVGAVDVIVRVFDKNNNPVIDGTTVDFSVSESARIIDESPVTSDGYATSRVIGNGRAGKATLNFTAHSINEQIELDIVPYLTAGQISTSYTVSGSTAILKAEISKRESVPIHFYANKGVLRDGGVTETNADGVASIKLYGNGEREVSFYACVSEGVCSSLTNVAIGPVPKAVSQKAFFVSEKVGSGVVLYDEALGNGDYAYQSQFEIDVSGIESGEKLTIGSAMHPNRAPVLLLPMTRNFKDDIYNDGGSALAVNTDVEWVYDHVVPNRTSASLAQAKVFSVNLDEQISNFSLSFKLKHSGMEESGLLLSLGEIVEIFNDGGALYFKFPFGSENFEFSLDNLQDNRWHDLALYLSGNEFSVWVDGNKVHTHQIEMTTSALSELVFSPQPYYLSDVAVYNLDSDPLYLFESGEEVIVIGASVESVVLSKEVEFDNDLVKVDVLRDSRNAVARLYASSEDLIRHFMQMAGAENVELAVNNYLVQYSRFYDSGFLLLNQAYQSDSVSAIDVSFRDILLAELAKKSGSLTSSDAENIRRIFSSVSEKGGRAIQSAMLQAIIKVQSSKDDDFRKLIIFFKIMSELYDTSFETFEFVVSGINGGSDLKVWQDYFSLPADGWIGHTPPVPALEVSCSDSIPLVAIEEGVELPVLACRQTGEDVILFLDSVAAGDLSKIDAEDFLHVLENLRQFVTMMPLESRRSLVSTRSQLFAASMIGRSDYIDSAHAFVPVIPILAMVARVGLRLSKEGIKNIISFSMGRSNSRVSPLWFYGSYLFLLNEIESEGECERCLDPGFIDEINRIFTFVMRSVLYKNKLYGVSNDGVLECKIWEASHGKVFEMLAIAYFHAMYKFMGDERYEVLSLQEQRSVVISRYSRKENFEDLPSIQRYSDVVLKGSGSRGVIVELKSAQARFSDAKFSWAKFSRKFPLWSAKRNRHTTFHRQMISDHALANEYKTAEGIVSPIYDDYIWLWQDWSRDAPRRYKRSRDPGVSLWEQKEGVKDGAGNSGVALREHMKNHGSNARAVRTIQRMFGHTVIPYVPLNGRVAGFPAYKRFDKLSAESLVAGQLEEHIDNFIDKDINDALLFLGDVSDKVERMEEALYKARKELRESGWLGPYAERAIREIEDQIDEIMEQRTEIEDELDEFAADMMPDSWGDETCQ